MPCHRREKYWDSAFLFKMTLMTLSFPLPKLISYNLIPFSCSSKPSGISPGLVGDTATHVTTPALAPMAGITNRSQHSPSANPGGGFGVLFRALCIRHLKTTTDRSWLSRIHSSPKCPRLSLAYVLLLSSHRGRQERDTDIWVNACSHGGEEGGLVVR